LPTDSGGHDQDRASEQRFRMLVDAVRDYAIVTLDPQGCVTSWNAGAERITGYPESAIIGRHIRIFFPPERARRGDPDNALDVARRTGRYEDENWRLRSDGSRYWANVVLTPVRDGSGDLTGFVQITRDLTERRRAEEALRTSEDRLAGIIASAMDAIITVDAEQRIVVFNAAAETIFRCRAEDAVGNRLDRFIPQRHRRAHARHVEEFGETGVTSRSMWRPGLLQALRADGEEFPIEASISQIDSGGQRFFTVILRDITERVRAQELLNAALETEHRLRIAAEAANRAKDQFMAVMSHELRTPLNGIIGYADLLEAGIYGTVSTEQARAMRRIRHSATHLVGIIDHVLAFARSENGVEVPEIEPIPIRPLLRDAASIIEPLALEKGIDFSVDVGRADLVAETDPGMVRQIVLNLLSNAVKFTEHGSVRLVARAESGADRTDLVLDIVDTGLGIHPDHLDRIFEPFWQAEQALTRRHGGTGLGLTVTRRLVEALEGSLTVHSAPGSGSTFSVHLPMQRVRVSRSA
jgi:PAS domain S-box-containing protein